MEDHVTQKRAIATDRRYFIGGSDARIIMGNDEAALVRLWREKRGEAEPEDLSGNLIVQLGLATEDLNRRWYERTTGQTITDVQRRVRHPTVRWLAATVDGRVAATGAVFEAKFMLPWSFTEEGARDRAGGAPRSPTRSSRAAPANRHRQPGFCKAIGWRTGSACSSGRRRNLNLVRRIRNGSVEPYSLSWGIAESRGSIAEDG